MTQANKLYHVSYGEQKKKLSFVGDDFDQLDHEIRKKFSISDKDQMRVQVQDDDFPDDWFELAAGDPLPQKAKIIVSVVSSPELRNNMTEECDEYSDVFENATDDSPPSSSEPSIRDVSSARDSSCQANERSTSLNEQAVHPGPSVNKNKKTSAQIIHCINERETVICGMTLLNNSLYVAYADDSKSIFVYDTETCVHRRTVSVPEMGGVNDMASCNQNQCVYTADNKTKVVHRVDSGDGLMKWSVNDTPWCLSVTSACSVLVTCRRSRQLKEYTSQGFLVREITLQTDIVHPCAAVELGENRFVVCHGWHDDPAHRVCTVNESGAITRSHGGKPGSRKKQLNVPVSLAVGKCIYVADCYNKRVIAVTHDLIPLRIVVSGLNVPCKISLDEGSCTLYVANNKFENGQLVSGHVNVYTLCE